MSEEKSESIEIARDVDPPTGDAPTGDVSVGVDRLEGDALGRVIADDRDPRWAELAAAVRHDPHGQVADRILAVCKDLGDGAGPWPAFVRGVVGTGRPGAVTLTELRRRWGYAVEDVARELGRDVDEVKALEAEAECEVSALSTYIDALGGRLSITARRGVPGEEGAVELGVLGTLPEGSSRVEAVADAP